MKDNGWEILDKDMVYKFGLMEQLTKDNGTITKVVVKANLLI